MDAPAPAPAPAAQAAPEAPSAEMNTSAFEAALAAPPGKEAAAPAPEKPAAEAPTPDKPAAEEKPAADEKPKKGLDALPDEEVEKKPDAEEKPAAEEEPEIRAETEGWLFAYLHLAYGPLPVDDLETYLAFSRTDAGKALNAALFDGYEAMYRDISYALGRAVALSAQGNDI